MRENYGYFAKYFATFPSQPPPVLGSVLKSAPQLDDKANYILDNNAKPQSLRRERKIKLLSSVWKLVSLGLKSEDAQSSWGD